MNEPAIASAPWVGTIALAPMAAVFVGSGGETGLHEHLAHKVLVGAVGVEIGRERRATPGAFAVPAGVPHRVLAAGRAVLLAYLDARRFRWDDAERLAWRWRRLPARLDVLASVLHEIAAVSARPVDVRALSIVEAVARGRTLVDVSRRLGLSESRVTHLVTEELGAPPRSWRRWLRLRDAVDLVAEGRNVTDAAHAAGFADSAHFSRTCTQTLGIPPSALRASRIDRTRMAAGCVPEATEGPLFEGGPDA